MPSPTKINFKIYLQSVIEFGIMKAPHESNICRFYVHNNSELFFAMAKMQTSIISLCVDLYSIMCGS